MLIIVKEERIYHLYRQNSAYTIYAHIYDNCSRLREIGIFWWKSRSVRSPFEWWRSSWWGRRSRSRTKLWSTGGPWMKSIPCLHCGWLNSWKKNDIQQVPIEIKISWKKVELSWSECEFDLQWSSKYPASLRLPLSDDEMRMRREFLRVTRLTAAIIEYTYTGMQIFDIES